jgi:hypothetical protein
MTAGLLKPKARIEFRERFRKGEGKMIAGVLEFIVGPECTESLSMKEGRITIALRECST